MTWTFSSWIPVSKTPRKTSSSLNSSHLSWTKNFYLNFKLLSKKSAYWNPLTVSTISLLILIAYIVRAKESCHLGGLSHSVTRLCLPGQAQKGSPHTRNYFWADCSTERKELDTVAVERKKFVMKPLQVILVRIKKTSFVSFTDICKLLTTSSDQPSPWTFFIGTVW